MIIGSISENKEYEKRVAVTPDVVNKYKNLGFEVHLIKNYADHLGFHDKFFIEAGATIVNDEKELISNSDILIQIGLLNENQLKLQTEALSNSVQSTETIPNIQTDLTDDKQQSISTNQN